MCEPASIIAGVAALVGVVITIVDATAKSDQAAEAKKSAIESSQTGVRLLTLRQMQEQEAAKQNMFFADMDARQAQAAAAVSAGESGVSGTSVDVILDDIERQRLIANTGMMHNVDGVVAQLSQEKNSVRANAQNQINANPAPNPYATGLRIAGAGADAAATYYRNKPTTGRTS